MYCICISHVRMYSYVYVYVIYVFVYAFSCILGKLFCMANIGIEADIDESLVAGFSMVLLPGKVVFRLTASVFKTKINTRVK